MRVTTSALVHTYTHTYTHTHTRTHAHAHMHTHTCHTHTHTHTHTCHTHTHRHASSFTLEPTWSLMHGEHALRNTKMAGMSTPNEVPVMANISSLMNLLLSVY